MTLNGTRTYVGFGFGAIQAGLFLKEAFQSSNFNRLVVAEVRPDLVAAIRRNRGCFNCNVALTTGLEVIDIGPIQIEDPAQPEDRIRLIEAIAGAEEIGTAIPSVDHYVTAEPGSLHRLLAAGLRQKAQQHGPRAVIYTAENHNHAAELLQDRVLSEIPPDQQPAILNYGQFLNTVIGKMSGTVSNPSEIQSQGLQPVTPELQRAFLVEAFNQILISRSYFDPPFSRGIEIFEEKVDLLPFEETKLYGHNGIHALAAYLGVVTGAKYISDLPQTPGHLEFLRQAFIEESGKALVKKYAGIDPLFTEGGFRQYADDLLKRMTNPYLRDSVERVARDPKRKLGWNDRLVGAIRLVRSQGIEPRRYALGAAAAIVSLEPNCLTHPKLASNLLSSIWATQAPALQEQPAVIEMIEDGLYRLNRWLDSGGQPLEQFC